MIYRLLFGLELMLGELIFLYPVKKRSHFGLRFILAVLGAFLCLAFIPDIDFFTSSMLLQLLLMIIYSGITYFAMRVSFAIKPGPLFSCCVAGYALQHIGFQLGNIIDYIRSGRGIQFVSAEMDQQILALICCLIVYAISYPTIGRFAAKNQYYLNFNLSCNMISIVVVVICMGLTRMANYYGIRGNIVISLYAITACVLALTVQFVLYHTISLEHENETINLLLMEKQRQYELSKKTIDTIDIKYHDLKHKLGHMNLPQEELEELKENMRIYGSMIKTGNEALDVLLTENNLRCTEDGIRLTCMGYGECLDFMNLMDVYSLFGNAIENAVEAVQKVEDPEKRVIDIVIEKVGDMISINISNYFNGNIVMNEDLPVSSKTKEKEFHGFGMKSMKLISEKYGGSLKIKTEGDLFVLDIYLMTK